MDLGIGLVTQKPCTGSTETKTINSRTQQGQRQPEATWEKRGHSFPWLCVCWPQEVCWTCRQDLSTLRSRHLRIQTLPSGATLLGFLKNRYLDSYLSQVQVFERPQTHIWVTPGKYSVWKWLKINISDLLLSFPLASVVEISEIQDLQFASYAKTQTLFCIRTSPIRHLLLHGLLQLTFSVSGWTV